MRRAGSDHLARRDAPQLAHQVRRGRVGSEHGRWPAAACRRPQRRPGTPRHESPGMKGHSRAHGNVASVPLALGRHSSAASDYVALTKPRLNLLVVATSCAGYYLGAPLSPDWLRMAEAVGATALVAGGAAVLNQVYERQTDALMRRTRERPLPDGRISPP